MAGRKDAPLDDEQRSYGALWLVCSLLLFVGALWAVADATPATAARTGRASRRLSIDENPPCMCALDDGIRGAYVA